MECITGTVPMKLCQDNSDALTPHLLAVSAEVDSLDDLPDVGAVLERSGILDDGTPTSLKSFDISDFTADDSGDVLPFDGILDLPDATSSILPQTSLPPSCGGMFSTSFPVPLLAHFPLESAARKQDLAMLHELNPFSTSLLAASDLVINHGGTSQHVVGSQFVSSLLGGSNDSGRLASRSRGVKTKSTDGCGLAYMNNREAPEYQRVMDILTEYHLQVAEKNGEAMKPCKRRKSRPLVDAVELAKSGSASTSTTSSPSTTVPLVSSPLHTSVNDLSASDSVGSASDLTHVSEQNSAGIVSIVYPAPVNRCALDAAVSDKMSCDMTDCVPSSNHWKDVTFQHQKQPLKRRDDSGHCDANHLNHGSSPVVMLRKHCGDEQLCDLACYTEDSSSEHCRGAEKCRVGVEPADGSTASNRVMKRKHSSDDVLTLIDSHGHAHSAESTGFDERLSDCGLRQKRRSLSQSAISEGRSSLLSVCAACDVKSSHSASAADEDDDDDDDSCRVSDSSTRSLVEQRGTSSDLEQTGHGRHGDCRSVEMVIGKPSCQLVDNGLTDDGKTNCKTEPEPSQLSCSRHKLQRIENSTISGSDGDVDETGSPISEEAVALTDRSVMSEAGRDDIHARTTTSNRSQRREVDQANHDTVETPPSSRTELKHSDETVANSATCPTPFIRVNTLTTTTTVTKWIKPRPAVCGPYQCLI